MKVFLPFILTILLPIFLTAQGVVQKAEVQTGEKGMAVFYELDIHPFHGQLEKNGQFTGYFSADDIRRLDMAGLEPHVLIPDLTEYYQTRESGNTRIMNVNPCFDDVTNYPTPEHFQHGSMGGYYVLDEVYAELDSMHMLFPDLITEKTQIYDCVSIEERPLYWLKISDNPNTDEDEPEVLYTAIHHSQEPASVQQLIHYMYFLLENYDTNPEIQYLVDNTEMYFVPMVNPDGYVYNETEDPEGGGMWRKNRRNNGLGGGYGVDLNRNYDYAFAWDDIGSGNFGLHPWYRGEYAFSEPESYAMDTFLQSRNILLDINWHTYSDMLIYPWNYESHLTPDSTFYILLSKDMTQENHYRYGTCYETYGYQSNGDADDWGYGETEVKNKIISMTGECGNSDDGFWPTPNRINDICRGTLRMNLIMAHYALDYARIEDLQSYIVPGSSGHMKFELQAVGLDTPSNFTVNYIPLSPEISFDESGVSFSDMDLMETRTDSIPYWIDAEQGTELGFVIAVDNGTYTFRDTVYKLYGPMVSLFEDDCEYMDNWEADDWDVTADEFATGTHSITESPDGNYGSFQTSEISPNIELDLSGYLAAVVRFKCKYILENNYDWVEFFVSTDGGDNWTPLCGKHSTVGTDDEDEGQPVYHNFTQSWIQEEVSLNDYIGETIKLKFRFEADQNNTLDGFYFDDFKVLACDPSIVSAQDSKSGRLQVYPNPANDYVRFVFPERPHRSRLKVYTISGQLKESIPVLGNSVHLNTKSYTDGLYLYQCDGYKGRFTLQK